MSLGPLLTVPLIVFTTDTEALSRMYQSSGVVPDEAAMAAMTSAMMPGTKRMKMNVRIDAELDFFISELKNMAIPVRENM